MLFYAHGNALQAGHGREIVVWRHMQEKDKAATDIIIKAVTRVILGDSLRVVETRAAEQLHYLYTGSWHISVRPPEIHPAVTLTTQLMSLLPYVGRLSDNIVAASTLAMQLVAISRTLYYRETQRSPNATVCRVSHSPSPPSSPHTLFPYPSLPATRPSLPHHHPTHAKPR